MKILVKWLINALALIGVAYLLPSIDVSSFYIALIVAVILAVFNLLFKPLLVILTLPINIITLGLFTFVINGFLFWFTATFVQGFYVEGFGWAIIGAFIYSIISYIGNTLFIEKDPD